MGDAPLDVLIEPWTIHVHVPFEHFVYVCMLPYNAGTLAHGGGISLWPRRFAEVMHSSLETQRTRGHRLAALVAIRGML